MERRDYLLQQIQMMGLFLQKLIARMLKRREDGDDGGIYDEITNEFNTEFKLDLDELVLLEDEDFFAILKEKNFSESHLESLAQLLFLLGKPADFTITVNQRNYLEKSLAIFYKIEKESQNFSMERNDRMAEIHQLLL